MPRFMRVLLLLACLTIGAPGFAQQFDITEGGLTVRAPSFGQGDHVVVALHGLRGSRVFNAFFAEHGDELAKAGLRVISIEWAGNHPEAGPAPLRASVTPAR